MVENTCATDNEMILYTIEDIHDRRYPKDLQPWQNKGVPARIYEGLPINSIESENLCSKRKARKLGIEKRGQNYKLLKN